MRRLSASFRSDLGLIDIFLHVLASAIPPILLIASLQGGVDTLAETAWYAPLAGLLMFGLLAGTKFRAFSALTALVCGFALIWALLGKFGVWDQARAEVLALMVAGSFFIAGRAIGQKDALLQWTWRVMIWSMLAFCIIAFIAYFLDMTGGEANASIRMKHAFGSANTAATLFGMFALVGSGYALYAFRHRQSSSVPRAHRMNSVIRRNLDSIVLVVLSLSCLLLTASRAGILIGFAMVCVYVGAEASEHLRLKRKRKKRRHMLATVAPLIVGAVFVLAGLSTDLMYARSSEMAGDAQGRVDLFRTYWGMWQGEPLFGHGLGSFNRLNDANVTLENAKLIGNMGAAHNIPLQWLIQQGIIGLGVLAAVWGAIHIRLVRALRGKRERSGTFLRMAICISALVILHGMVDYAMEIPSVMWLYAFILGIATGRAGVVSRVSRLG